MVAPGGHVHGCSRGACMVAPGGVCVVARGHVLLLPGVVWLLGGCAWLLPGGHVWLLLGACMVAPRGQCVVAPGGMHGCSGGVHAWDMTRYGDMINERAVRILLECILVAYISAMHGNGG